MKVLQVQPNEDFKVIGETSRSQAAIMVLDPNSSTGGKDNVHKNSDQWLYVISGSGKAIIDSKEIEIASGTLLLIEAGEAHEIINMDENPLKTLNFYCPPEY
jgi:mannose-6-phosphate isomerase-like protein (cupin superfamily)